MRGVPLCFLLVVCLSCSRMLETAVVAAHPNQSNPTTVKAQAGVGSSPPKDGLDYESIVLAEKGSASSCSVFCHSKKDIQGSSLNDYSKNQKIVELFKKKYEGIPPPTKVATMSSEKLDLKLIGKDGYCFCMHEALASVLTLTHPEARSTLPKAQEAAALGSLGLNVVHAQDPSSLSCDARLSSLKKNEAELLQENDILASQTNHSAIILTKFLAQFLAAVTEVDAKLDNVLAKADKLGDPAGPLIRELNLLSSARHNLWKLHSYFAGEEKYIHTLRSIIEEEYLSAPPNEEPKPTVDSEAFLEAQTQLQNFKTSLDICNQAKTTSQKEQTELKNENQLLKKKADQVQKDNLKLTKDFTTCKQDRTKQLQTIKDLKAQKKAPATPSPQCKTQVSDLNNKFNNAKDALAKVQKEQQICLEKKAHVEHDLTSCTHLRTTLEGDKTTLETKVKDLILKNEGLSKKLTDHQGILESHQDLALQLNSELDRCKTDSESLHMELEDVMKSLSTAEDVYPGFFNELERYTSDPSTFKSQLSLCKENATALNTDRIRLQSEVTASHEKSQGLEATLKTCNLQTVEKDTIYNECLTVNGNLINDLLESQRNSTDLKDQLAKLSKTMQQISEMYPHMTEELARYVKLGSKFESELTQCHRGKEKVEKDLNTLKNLMGGVLDIFKKNAKVGGLSLEQLLKPEDFDANKKLILDWLLTQDKDLHRFMTDLDKCMAERTGSTGLSTLAENVKSQINNIIPGSDQFFNRSHAASRFNKAFLTTLGLALMFFFI